MVAFPAVGWYQIILLGDRGTCVLTTYPGLHSTPSKETNKFNAIVKLAYFLYLMA